MSGISSLGTSNLFGANGGANPLQGLSGLTGANGSSGSGKSGDKSKLLEGFVRMAASSKDQETAKAAKAVLGGLGLDTSA